MVDMLDMDRDVKIEPIKEYADSRKVIWMEKMNQLK